MAAGLMRELSGGRFEVLSAGSTPKNSINPIVLGKRYEDWVLEDPAEQGIEAVRVIRDEIKRRVHLLLKELVI